MYDFIIPIHNGPAAHVFCGTPGETTNYEFLSMNRTDRGYITNVRVHRYDANEWWKGYVKINLYLNIRQTTNDFKSLAVLTKLVPYTP